MSKKKRFLSDYIRELGSTRSGNAALPSFLFLAEFLYVDGGTDFISDSGRYPLDAHRENAVPERLLTPEQIKILDTLASQDSDVLDILCTIARFSNFDCPPGKIRRVTKKIKGHLGDKVKIAEQLAGSVLHISFDCADESPPVPLSTPVMVV